MIKALITDFSRVLLFPKDKKYSGSLNGLHKELSTKPGYSLLSNFELNTELLNFYESLKHSLTVGMFTSETIQDSPELTPYLEPVFTKIYSALKLGMTKKDPTAYTKISTDLGFQPEEILYIDDSEENIAAAKEAGMKTHLYQNNSGAQAEILMAIQ